MVRRAALLAALGAVAATLQGCGSAGSPSSSSTSTTAAASTTTAASTTGAASTTTATTSTTAAASTTTSSTATTSTAPNAYPNPFCTALEAAELPPLQVGGPIGWPQTSTMVGAGHWCAVNVPPATWKLQNFCGAQQEAPKVEAKEGFTVERFLAQRLQSNMTAPAPNRVKVLSYNLYWWNLFQQQKGANGMAGKNIAAGATDETFDLMGFQECEDVSWPLRDAKAAGLQGTFNTVVGDYATALAYRAEAFDLIATGKADVGEDGPQQHYGRRAVLWARLHHKATGRTVFFINHHGPTPVNSGGVCGPSGTAYNILKVIGNNAQVGDAIILVGDFNAWSNDPNGHWLEEIGKIDCHLPHAFSNPVVEDVWGIDNVFAACARTAETTVMAKGGSDHNALSVVFEL